MIRSNTQFCIKWIKHLLFAIQIAIVVGVPVSTYAVQDNTGNRYLELTQRHTLVVTKIHAVEQQIEFRNEQLKALERISRGEDAGVLINEKGWTTAVAATCLTVFAVLIMKRNFSISPSLGSNIANFVKSFLFSFHPDGALVPMGFITGGTWFSLHALNFFIQENNQAILSWYEETNAQLRSLPENEIASRVGQIANEITTDISKLETQLLRLQDDKDRLEIAMKKEKVRFELIHAR